MLTLNWPIVLTTTVLLYAGILITLPFNPVYATVLLFTLIAFWSRLPGVGVVDPSYILYLADFVDIFSFLVAINLGGIYGGIVALFGNLLSRLCGVYPLWYMVLEDAAGQFLVCLMIPFIHAALGGNILFSMMAYTVLRIIIILPVDFFLYPYSKVQWIIEIIVGIFALFIINSFYAKAFGGFFDNLLKQGVQFSWALFLFATAVIFIFYISVFGFSRKKSPHLQRTIKKYIIKKRKKPENRFNDDSEFEEIKKIKEIFDH